MNNNKGPLAHKPDYLVCACMGVMHSEICDSIKMGARDINTLSQELMVGLGCSSCIQEIQKILDNMRDS
jgi:bacterioferritin-associated ferredoxin